MVDHDEQPNAGDAARQGASASPGERVAKALARAGVASRREVERYIADGRVSLNGRVLDTPAVKVMPGDVLAVDGAPVAAAEATRVWRYHKPVGLVTTHADPQGRPTVFEALPPGLPRVISIGRLDLNSEGLLLLTNDGELARALELPSTGWVRRYRARAYGRTSQAELDRLKDGITVEGVSYGPIDARLDKAKGGEDGGSANCWISVALTEGRNREVRKVLQALGLKVNRLVRLAYGPFALTTLPTGALEEVGPRVIREQLAAFIAPEDMPTGQRAAQTGVVLPSRRGASAAPVGDGGVKPAKKTYKPGWARPAKKLRPHPAPKRKPREAEAPLSSPAQRGRGTMRSMVEGASPRAKGEHPKNSARDAPSVTARSRAAPPSRGSPSAGSPLHRGGKKPGQPRKPKSS